MKLCLDLSRCYYPHWGRLAWAVCLKLLVESFKAFQKLKLRKNAENLLGICKSVAWTTIFKKCWSVKPIKILVCSLGLLVVLLLLWGCSTSQSSQYSAQSSQIQPSSPLPHQKVKSRQKYFGDSSYSQVDQKLHQQSQLDTSLWSQSPLWEQSSGFISLQEGARDSIEIKFNIFQF